MIDDEADFDNLNNVQVQTAAKFRPKQRIKPWKAAPPSKSAAHDPSAESKDGKERTASQGNSSGELTSQGRASMTCPGSEAVDDVASSQGGASTIDAIIQNVRGDNVAAATPMDGFCAENNDLWTTPKDQETITDPVTQSPQDVHGTVDLESYNELLFEEVSGEPTVKSQPNIGTEKGKGKSVSFVLPDDPDGVSPTNINSEMGNLGYSCNDTSTDENLNNSLQQTAEKHCISKENYSNARQYTDKETQSHDMGPSDHAVEQQPKSDVGETGSSMKLRSRKKYGKVGIAEHRADDYSDEDNVGPSAAEQDNDIGDNYTAGDKQKIRRKSRDGISKKPPRDSMPMEETRQKKVKRQVSSRGRKRTLNDEATEKPEKKLTHRIRQKRMKEVQTLLETPYHQIDHKKLSAAHLRLLQEARERINGKELASGPSSNTSTHFEDLDDDFYRDEAQNFDNDRAENNALLEQNATKLNYHSYMNKQTQAKWSKSDTDLFYQGLRQFGSDFAMIQQLFSDKTRYQVQQKFKSEEKKNPMLLHDAILHRLGDNVYFKKVIKRLNIEDVLSDINNACKQESASNGGGPGNENALDDFIDEEENRSSWSDKEQGTHSPDVQVGNVDDDLGDVFDCY